MPVYRASTCFHRVSAMTEPETSYHPGPGWQLRYGAIFAGQALSLIGSAMTQFVLLWWITDTTGSVSALALAGLFALLPQALLGPVAGTFVDRYSRKLIMILADLVTAACMGILVMLFLTDSIALWHLYTLMAVRSAMQAFQQPAIMASVPMLVPESFLTRANGLTQTMMGLMSVAAAPLGALAISIMPIGWALSIDIFTALLGIIPLAIFAIPQKAKPEGAADGMWAEFTEGVAAVRQDRGLFHIFILLGAVLVIIMPCFTLVPLLVKEHFGGAAREVAIIESVGGMGMVAGGALIAVIAPKRRVPWFLWGWGLSCIAMGLMAATNTYWIGVVWWLVSGVTFIAGNAPLNAIFQSRVPNHLLGRVMSLMGTVMGLAAPVGLAIMTPLGELFGVRWVFVILGVGGGIVTLMGYFSYAIRDLDRPQKAA